MFNLLRMDLRRFLRSKSFYICLAILAASTVLTFALIYVMANPYLLERAVEMGFDVTQPGTEGEFSQEFAGTTILSLFHQTNISGGMFSITACIFAVINICIEFSGGFIKNILSTHKNKWDYILSKFLSFSIVNFLFLTATFLLTNLLNFITGNYFTYDSIPDILFYGVTEWFIMNAFCALIILICMITKNVAASIASAIFVCSGVIVMLAGSLLSLFGLQKIIDYTLYMNMSNCPFTYSGPSDLLGLIIAVIFLILYLIAGQIVLDRKDV